jgi:hypothetical protein
VEPPDVRSDAVVAVDSRYALPLGSDRSSMSEWEESMDRGRLAAPASGFPPAVPPPTGCRPRSRAVAVAVVVVVVLLAAAGGALLARSRLHPPATPSASAQVRSAYLAWWAARVKAYETLDPTPMKPYMTAAGYTQEEGRMAQGPGDPLKLIATHNLQIAVYTGGRWASVDDIWVDSSVTLDPATHQPNGPPAGLTIEDSTTFEHVGDKWLVNDLGRFGVNPQVQGQSISYAASADGVPPAEPLRQQIIDAFQRYRAVDDSAFLDLSGQSLSQVETGAALTASLKALNHQIALGQAVRFQDQDSYRIGIENATTAWIYDTDADQSVAIDVQTKALVNPEPLTVFRSTYGLTKEAGEWVVFYFGGN